MFIPYEAYNFTNSVIIHLNVVVDEKNSKDRQMATAARGDRSIPADDVTPVTRPISVVFPDITDMIQSTQ